MGCTQFKDPFLYAERPNSTAIRSSPGNLRLRYHASDVPRIRLGTSSHR